MAHFCKAMAQFFSAMGSHGTHLPSHGSIFSAMSCNGILFLGNGQPWHTFARPCLKFLCNAQLRHTFARPCLLLLGNGQPWHTFYQERSGKGTPLPGLGAAMASRWHNFTSKAMGSQGMPMTNFLGLGGSISKSFAQNPITHERGSNGVVPRQAFGHEHRKCRLALLFHSFGYFASFLDTLLYFGRTLVRIVRPLGKVCPSRRTLFLCAA